MFLQNYLPDSKWKLFYDKSVAFDPKLEGFVDFAIEVLGLRHPNDATLKVLMGIVLLCHGVELSPDDFYEKLQCVKDKFTEKRPLFPGKPLMAIYDRDPQQFIKLHPRQFAECDPPIASRLDERSIQQRTRKDLMPTRSTNKHLKKNKTSNATTSTAPAADIGSSVASRCLDFILGGGAASAPPPIMDRAHPLSALLPPSAAPPAGPKGLLAIADVPAAPKAAPPSGAATIDSILDQARNTLKKGGPKAKAAGGPRKRRKNAKVPSTDEDEDNDDEDSDDEEESEQNSELKKLQPFLTLAFQIVYSYFVILFQRFWCRKYLSLLMHDRA